MTTFFLVLLLKLLLRLWLLRPESVRFLFGSLAEEGSFVGVMVCQLETNLQRTKEDRQHQKS